MERRWGVKGMLKPSATARSQAGQRSGADKGQERVWMEDRVALAVGHGSWHTALD